MAINGKNNQGRLWLCFHSRFSPCGHPAIKDNPITGTSTMWIPGENNLQMIEWNLFPLLWTLDNDETDSRSLHCPLLRELIGISLFHKVLYWLFMYIFLVSLVKVLSKSFPGQEQQHSADDSSSWLLDKVEAIKWAYNIILIKWGEIYIVIRMTCIIHYYKVRYHTLKPNSDLSLQFFFGYV